MTEVLNLDQNTPAWLAARTSKIGSSDTPIILGISPFKTALQLYNEKLGLSEPFKGNFATDRGHAMEQPVREKVEFRLGMLFPPVTLVKGSLIASLDGYNKESSLVLEIKNPGHKAHEIAQKGGVPDYYMPQIQHQMYVADAPKCVYASFYKDELVIVEVDFDKEYWADVLKKIEFFHYCMESKTPPVLSSKDFDNIQDSDLAGLCATYTKAKDQIAYMEANAKAVMKEIVARVTHDKTKVISGDNSYSISAVNRKGNVDYKKVPELKGVDLEPYRGSAVRYFTVKKDK